MKALIILIAYTLNGQTGEILKTVQIGGPYQSVEQCSAEAEKHAPEHPAKDMTVTVYNCAVRPVQGGGEDL